MKETRSQTSYLLWLACIFQVHGLHRLYNGKIGTGLLWMCTFGFFWVGQVVDLFLIPNMVEEHNLKLRAKLGMNPYGVPLDSASVQPTLVKEQEMAAYASTKSAQPLTEEELMIKLTQAAQRRGGKISVTQGVIDTEANFAEVEQALKQMVKKGYVGVENHPVSGVVMYDFLEL
jgi:TM2 domain-containing membrane protein YozV